MAVAGGTVGGELINGHVAEIDKLDPARKRAAEVLDADLVASGRTGSCGKSEDLDRVAADIVAGSAGSPLATG